MFGTTYGLKTETIGFVYVSATISISSGRRKCERAETFFFKGLVVYVRRLGDGNDSLQPGSTTYRLPHRFSTAEYKRAFISDKTRIKFKSLTKKILCTPLCVARVAFITAKAQERPSSSIPCRSFSFKLCHQKNSNRFFFIYSRLPEQRRQELQATHRNSSISFNIFLLRNQHLPMIIIRNEQIK